MKKISTLYIVVGIVLSASGFISGIIEGSNAKNFGYCLQFWIGFFLIAIIYFGIGYILKNQETIIGKLNFYFSDKNENGSIFKAGNLSVNCTNSKNVSTTPIFRDINRPATSSANEWKCQNCGAINKNYVGTCGCGNIKPNKYTEPEKLNHAIGIENSNKNVDILFCPNCGATIKESSRFCSKCGVKVK